VSTTIYFSGAITGGREDVALYRRIVDALEADGYRVFAGGVAAAEVGAGGEALDVREIFTRDLHWLDASDLVVAEVSTPSHGVGYEIAYARYVRQIPVIALFRRGRTQRCSAMIAGDAEVRVIEYADVESAIAALREEAQRKLESGRGRSRSPDRLA
jgi:nucleoside 2-deoxyribosyltransferase